MECHDSETTGNLKKDDEDGDAVFNSCEIRGLGFVC